VLSFRLFYYTHKKGQNPENTGILSGRKGENPQFNFPNTSTLTHFYIHQLLIKLDKKG
jgi:hypothetical protein